jgi:phosphopantetheine--protein transferase-like protein
MDILELYRKLSNKKGDVRIDDIIQIGDFNSIMGDRFVSELKKIGILWDRKPIKIENLLSSDYQKQKNAGLEVKNGQFGRPYNGIKGKIDVGIDIEFINHLPDTQDYWEHEFYLSTFTKNEISYCVRQNNPSESFIGIYSCKEAILKCSGNFTSMEQIEINHYDSGKPYFQDFGISISHSKDICIAIAIKIDDNDSKTGRLISDYKDDNSSNEEPKDTLKSKSTRIFWTQFLIIISSLIILYFVLKEFGII